MNEQINQKIEIINPAEINTVEEAATFLSSTVEALQTDAVGGKPTSPQVRPTETSLPGVTVTFGEPGYEPQSGRRDPHDDWDDTATIVMTDGSQYIFGTGIYANPDGRVHAVKRSPGFGLEQQGASIPYNSPNEDTAKVARDFIDLAKQIGTALEERRLNPDKFNAPIEETQDEAHVALDPPVEHGPHNTPPTQEQMQAIGLTSTEAQIAYASLLDNTQKQAALNRAAYPTMDESAANAQVRATLEEQEQSLTQELHEAQDSK
ncbi:hypothetical protein KBD20_02260 [Candidatus Saccharibacteria bacterium]|nr:hypothetical protein [Candidatus Saccharibacteria bacterium]